MLLLGQSGEFAFQVSTETPVFLEDKGFFLKKVCLAVLRCTGASCWFARL